MNVLENSLHVGLTDADRKLKALGGEELAIQSQGPRMLPLDEVGSLLGGEEQTVSGVAMGLLKEPPLQFLMLMDRTAKDSLVAALAGPSATDDDELAASVLQELGNILGSCMANALAPILKMSVRTSVPEVVNDLAGAILSGLLGSFEHLGDQVLMVDVVLTVAGEPVCCHLTLFMDEALNTMLVGNLREG